MNQSNELVALLYNHAFRYQGQRVELILNLLRVDILTVCAEQHVLATTLDEDVAVTIHSSEIACMIPSVLVNGLLGSFLILIVTQHYVRTLGKDFARYILRIRTIDADHHVEGSLTARARYEVFVILVADDRGTFCCAISHGIFETYAMEETFHFLVKGCTTDNHLVEVATEGIGYLVAYLLLHLLADHRHVEQHTHAVVLDLREYLLADNLLDNQRYRYDDGWLDAAECLGNDGWTRDAGEIEDVAALDEFEDKFKRHAVHVGHRQDTDDRISRLDLLTQYVLSKICIAPECTVWNHYSLGETGSSAGIVDHSQLIRILFHIVVDMVFAEVLRILDTEHLVEVFACISQLVGT